ncbi:helix-turn-helix transcriptional regulator [Enterobacter kobei]|uniref:helix-turn-helix domain-containing protein n=1 Tax=Enterobacter kobei TaxID=208224 RepID=UPI00168B4AF3|nr:helix-turn-helix transcriptional regulator [Enterobacter kobei]MBD3602160.1 helix-turn-helix transcriptional regulator [Enterobacter kobei]HDZ8321225.1 helix-turn-helix transcriptional regulator [Enterobacter kobei]
MQTFEKLKAIRKAEGLTQTKFSELSGIALGTIKNYESGQKEPGLSVVLRVTNAPLFQKYTLWLMTDKTAPQAGQIAPAFAHSGQEQTESDHSEKKIG